MPALLLLVQCYIIFVYCNQFQQIQQHLLKHDFLKFQMYFFSYFSADSTAEMLAEWRPLLCPFDAVMSQGIYYLAYFLPTCLMPEEQNKGFGYASSLSFNELYQKMKHVSICYHPKGQGQEQGQEQGQGQEYGRRWDRQRSILISLESLLMALSLMSEEI